MIITAKSNHKPEQLMDRVNKGFKEIELQLTNDFLIPNKDLNDYFKSVLNNSWDIISIHMPLISGQQDINLEFLTCEKYKPIFIEVCTLAQKCAEFYKHDVTIVLHNSFSLKMYELIPCLFNEVKKILEYCIAKFPNVTYSMENIFPINVKYDYIFLQNCSFLENVELAQYFNDFFNVKRFYTTLDICHALCTLKIMELYKSEPRYQKFLYTLESFFDGNKHLINNIHLNNIRNMGIEKGDHSAKFDKDNPNDTQLLCDILKLYKKYNLTCNITIEIDEANYDDAILAKECKDLINEQLMLLKGGNNAQN